MKGDLDDGAKITPVTNGYQPLAGVYTLVVKATDAAGNNSQSQPIRFAVYDPTGGFVTGAGFIDSPPGAYTPRIPRPRPRRQGALRVRVEVRGGSTIIEHVVYDNGKEQAIGGGNILVHAK